MTTSRESAIERLHRQFGRAAYAGVGAGLSAGIALYLLRQQAAAAFVLASTFGLLIALPVVNVLAAFAEEVRRRDWWFALLAAAVLALLACAIAMRA